MKTLEAASNTTQFPDFWTEEWLEAAIKELDTHAMTPEKRMAYEATLSVNAMAVEKEQERIEAVKVEAIRKALKHGRLTLDEIADYNSVSVKFVKHVQRSMQNNL